MRELIDELNDICETEVNMPLSSMTTLRIGGYAKYVVYPNSDIARKILHTTFSTNNNYFKKSINNINKD